MSELVRIILSPDQETRNRSLDSFCRAASADTLLCECQALEELRRCSDNLYVRVRALFFLSSIHRMYLAGKAGVAPQGRVPFDGFTHLLQRRFEEAIRSFLAAQAKQGANQAASSALAVAYRSLAFQNLADQVRRSVRSVRGNQWMFRTGHPADYPLRVRPELMLRHPSTGVFPALREATPVRMDLSHSGWSDIFFLGMDFPEGARVLNTSIDLAVRGVSDSTPKPPVEAYLRVIDEPLLRLTSIDLGATADITALAEVFDFGRDYLGLLKAAIIAAGIVPPGMEGSGQSLAELLAELTGRAGCGLEVVSKVNDIPKGSRLAVSTNLLASLISVCMRATSQIHSLTGGLQESDRRLVAARAILGEWLGGSGGGWQDSGGVWPGMKLIEGVVAGEGDVEYGISRGCLLPRHRVFPLEEITAETRLKLQQSLVLVHGGMAQDVGPILEMVTEKYLLRGEREWHGRLQAMGLLDEIIDCLRRGDIRGVGACTQRNFDGPIQTIIPWAANQYTLRLIEAARRDFGDAFWGFWMLGGMAGGGMGFLFAPEVKPLAQQRMAEIMSEAKQAMDRAVPFAMEPVVYDFTINERGTWAELLTGEDRLLPAGYYALRVPELVRRQTRELTPAQRGDLMAFGEACRHRPELTGMVQTLFDRLLPRDANRQTGSTRTLHELLEDYGFDRVQHEKIRADLRSGRIGLAQNRLPVSSRIEDVSTGEVTDARQPLSARLVSLGAQALAEGAVAVVSLAGGAGSRWTKGAGVVKALNPFVMMAGRHRSFVEIHLAKSRQASRRFGRPVAHVFTTSYFTHPPMQQYLQAADNYGYKGPLYLSPGRSVGLRLIPTARDLRFAWQEMPQQVLDDQKQKVRDSGRAALMNWATSLGEASDYTDNLPQQCLHPVGHWYEVPNLLRNGTLRRLLEEQPGLRYILLHNIDTTGVSLDPGLLGLHIDSGAAITTEVIGREVEDHGGGLARVNGRVRLIEGMALPDERLEFELSYYNSNTMWISIDALLRVFALRVDDLANDEKTAVAVRNLAARMPTYITLKDVKKRWGTGQEDIYPVTQFEKLWGDMTALPELHCGYAVVPRMRGQQLKEVAQLDGWLCDGSAAFAESQCDW
ncbi:UTP--glucose-1-phosphate uridylyltransferase [uncultured Paludibaculum sp.]|uniref:UTP--glucose-1-phosphate uridylyltransferase n=1 Tax=uncultured Paludibaculum sp. TaxID=1765020 RepID=UPI002AAC42BA|nr:UTP--glucose-1-phosphate uridylyltransferase [uncultured Paludibaculum sp.]